MDFKAFVAKNHDWDVVTLDSGETTLMSMVSHISPAMKLWLGAMVVNFVILAIIM